MKFQTTLCLVVLIAFVDVDAARKKKKTAPSVGGANNPDASELMPFDSLDEDGDGIVQEKESMDYLMTNVKMLKDLLGNNPQVNLKALIKKLRTKAADIFAKADADNSGGLDKAEYEKSIGPAYKDFMAIVNKEVMGAMMGGMMGGGGASGKRRSDL